MHNGDALCDFNILHWFPSPELLPEEESVGKVLPPFRLNNINLNIQFPLLVFDTFAELKARSISSLRSISRGSFFPHQMKPQEGV